MSSMAGESILLEVRDGVAYVTLNAPPLNILTTAMLDALGGALGRVQADPSLKALCITANIAYQT
jgi:enoyl-CoA hydratase/carnithine racemase